jgi:hypothetical protein
VAVTEPLQFLMVIFFNVKCATSTAVKVVVLGNVMKVYGVEGVSTHS